LIYANSKIAGFVLVNAYTCLEENAGAKSIAEFFVMRKYRRRGIGKQAAFLVFDMFPGKWEVRQIRSNLDGYRFWKRVIAEYTNNHFTDTFLDDRTWRGSVQSFDNSTRIPNRTKAARPS
jgi:predicted acetyltransferase